MKRAARTDQSHADMRELFRAHGLRWHDTHQLGAGFPDAIIGWQKRLALVELKNAKGTLTPDQIKFHGEWPVFVVRDEASALQVIQTMKGQG